MPVEARERAGITVFEKRLSPRERDDATAVRRARDEAELTARLAPTGAVPRVVAHGEDAAGPFLITAALPFPTLAEAAPRALGAAKQAFEALARIHDAGVVHADITPANVAIGPDGTTVFLDFGLAAFDGAAPRDGAFVGTIGYAAPEIARGEAPSVASDLFGLAATLVFAATGRPPRPPMPSLAAAIADAADVPIVVPSGLPAAIAACLAHDPRARPESARAVVALLSEQC